MYSGSAFCAVEKLIVTSEYEQIVLFILVIRKYNAGNF